MPTPPSESRAARVTWVTNFAAPYRLPLWTELAKSVRLSVVLDHAGDPSVDAAARGIEWSRAVAAGEGSYAVTLAPVWRPHASGRELTVRRRFPAAEMADTDVLVLGGWQAPIYWQYLASARKRDVRAVGFYESTQATQRFRSGPIKRAREHFFRALDAVVTPGPAATAAVLDMGVDPARIRTGFNCVDVDTFRDRAMATRASAPSVTPGHHFLFVGQLIERKNIDAMISAFDRVRAPEDTMTIVGAGPLEASLREQVRRLGLTDSVTFTGGVPYAELPAVMATRQTLVLASREEVWGLVVNEALAAGLHVVVGRDCGVVASVADMPGVFPTGSTAPEIGEALIRSRTAWEGWNDIHPILECTPSALATTFLDAFALSEGRRNRVHSHPQMSRRPRLVIVQPYVPKYRVPFFSGLVEALDAIGIDCVVAAPATPSGGDSRGDAASGDAWHHITKGKAFSTPWATFTSYGSRRLLHDADVVIVPAAASCLDTHLALARQRRGQRVGLWGHIGSYVNESSRLDAVIERRMLRQADHVFAYTQGGRDAAHAQGVDPDAVTTVMNTIDTETLVAAAETLGDAEADEFRELHGMTDGKVLGFVGALDESKRINFLVKVLDELWAIDPAIKLIVGGTGPDSAMFDLAVSRKQVIRLGYAGTRDKALIARVSEALVMPGRIGLIAVDALAFGLPILSTTWRRHSPEIDYLVEGVDRFTFRDDPRAYAYSVTDWLATGKHDTGSGLAGVRLEDMISNFRVGVETLLG